MQTDAQYHRFIGVLLDVEKPADSTGVDRFGPDRCLFESNFALGRVSHSYKTMYKAFKQLSEGYWAAGRAFMVNDTAVCVYRFDA